MHVADPGLVPGTPYDHLSLAGVITESVSQIKKTALSVSEMDLLPLLRIHSHWHLTGYLGHAQQSSGLPLGSVQGPLLAGLRGP